MLRFFMTIGARGKDKGEESAGMEAGCLFRRADMNWGVEAGRLTGEGASTRMGRRISADRG